MNPGTDREDTIISVPADRVLRQDFARKVKLDLSSPELECAAGYFPLNLALDNRRKSAWHQRYVQADQARWDIWSHFEERVLNRIIAFQVPFIRLPHETPKDAVCSVFERVNTGGVVLNVFELLTATYAGDRGYARTNGADFNLAEYWRGAKARLSAAYPVLGALENGQETGLTSIDFLQAISLVSTYEKKRQSSDGSGHAVGCKRRDLLRLPLGDFLHWAPVVENAFEWVGAFLTRQCVYRTEDLPYRTQLVPLAAIRTILGDRTDEFEAQIARWYWCGVLGELYGGSTESRFPRDVEQVVAWQSGAELPDTVAEATFQEQRLETLTSRNSAAYKGIYALLIKQGAVDWYFTEGPVTQEILVGQTVDIRQIFPKNWFERQGAKTPAWAASIVNKTPLSYRASRGISGAPSAYLKDLARESGTPDDWFDDLLGTHLIDAKALRADDVIAFLAYRVEKLLGLIADTMGKPPVRLDGERGAGEE